MLPGIIPTLGVATLKAALLKYAPDISCKVIYPSLQLSLETKFVTNPKLIKVMSAVPLQVVEYIFAETENAVDKSSLSEYKKLFYEYWRENGEGENADWYWSGILWLKDICREYLIETVNHIVQENPRLLIFSAVFGDNNFIISLSQKVKEKLPTVKIIVGGFNHGEDLANKYLEAAPFIDYIVQDTRVESFIFLCRTFLNGKNTHITDDFFIEEDLNAIPLPNFDDYFAITDKYNIKRDLLTLPYEASRGCWWAAKKACNICGFFGEYKSYIEKRPEKIYQEIVEMTEKYGIHKIRFTDLILSEHHRKELILKFEGHQLSFFFEVRANLNRSDIMNLRKSGVTMVQGGIESLSTECLKLMNKGTIAAKNIELMINLQSMGISLYWNYLYDIPKEDVLYYIQVKPLLPLLTHLQPPSFRRMWIQKGSYYHRNGSQYGFSIRSNALTKCIYPQELEELCIFYEDSSNKREWTFLKHKNIYDDFHDLIDEWKKAFKKGSSLIMHSIEDEIQILDNRPVAIQPFYSLKAIQRDVYLFFKSCHTFEKACLELPHTPEEIRDAIDYLIQHNLLIFLDNMYLSLAVETYFPELSQVDQVCYIGKELYQNQKENCEHE